MIKDQDLIVLRSDARWFFECVFLHQPPRAARVKGPIFSIVASVALGVEEAAGVRPSQLSWGRRFGYSPDESLVHHTTNKERQAASTVNLELPARLYVYEGQAMQNTGRLHPGRLSILESNPLPS